jgi:hypothetical protein
MGLIARLAQGFVAPIRVALGGSIETRMKIRADRYAIVSASASCPACARWTHVVALVAPQRHERLGEHGWESVAERASLFYVTQISLSVSRRLASVCPWYRLATAGPEACFANHCEHCAQPLEDHELHCEPGGAFQPRNLAEAEDLCISEVDEVLDVDASGFSHDPAF